MLLKTTGLEYDDRVKKEATSLISLKNKVKIVGVVNENLKQKGKSDYGAEYQLISLVSRKILPHKKGLIIKVIEMYIKFFFYILREEPDIIWLHNLELVGLVPVCALLKRIKYIKKIIWDQHELPYRNQFNNGVYRRLFKNSFNKCDFVIGANEERIEYLKKTYKVYANFIVLNNFPDRQFISYKYSKLSNYIENWLDGADYIYLQGATNEGRFLEEIILAILKYNKLKLIIVGYEDKKLFEKVKKKYKERIKNMVLFTGFLKQWEFISLIDNARFSIVLYDDQDINSYFCASNRLYQSISRGTPVLVGCNPTLRKVIKETRAGVVINGFGKNVRNIISGITRMEDNYTFYKENTLKAKEDYIWESQIKEIRKIIV